MKIYKHLGVFILFLFAAVFITFPLVFNLGSLASGKGDELLITWIQNWIIHSLANGQIFNIFNANIYYPFQNSLAYSDALFTTSVFSIIPLFLFKEPIVTFNFTLISSLALLGFSIYLTSWYLSRNIFSSFLAGILVVFSPAVLDKMVHVQILSIYFVLFSILFFIHFIKTKKSRFLFISFFFFILQMYNSIFPGYFILFSNLIIFVYFWIYDKKKINKLITKNNILLIIFSFVIIIPIIIPYFQVSRQFDYRRDIRDSIHFALQPEDLFYPSSSTRLNNILISLPFNQHSQNNEFKVGYLGLVFSILGIFVLIFSIKFFKREDIFVKSFLTIGFLGLILSLGPLLHIGRQTIHEPFPIPLPYALFYYVIPGFQGFRNSGRWEMIFIISLAILIAMILPKLLLRLDDKKQILFYSLLILGVILEFNFPMQYTEIISKKRFPPEYLWLSLTPNNSKIIEMPVMNWNVQPFVNQEILREYYGTLHFRKSINGYSGFSPEPWQDLVNNLLVNFPSEKSIDKLNKYEIDYIVVHQDEYDEMNKSKAEIGGMKIKNGEQIINEINKNKKLKLVKRFDKTYIFVIR